MSRLGVMSEGGAPPFLIATSLIDVKPQCQFQQAVRPSTVSTRANRTPLESCATLAQRAHGGRGVVRHDSA